MTPTRLRTLALIAAVAGALAYVFFRARYGSFAVVPWSVSVTTFGLAVAEAFWAPGVRARLEGRPRTRPILPIAVARTAAFAKASSPLGALLAGAWAGILVYVLPRRTQLAAAGEDTWRAALGLLTALLLVAAALRLERVCRVPPPPPEQPPS